MGFDQFALRRDTMLRGLHRARTVISQVVELDPVLGKRLQVRFGPLASEVEDGFGGKVNVADPAELLEKGEDLVAETLAFVGGAAARRYGLDEGMTALALAWLDKLSGQANLTQVGVVIPASTEFTGMATQVIRLKMPSDGIWALPVAVHEYGHFVASVLPLREDVAGMPKATIPVEQLLHESGAKGELPRLYWHGHELFADALATVVTGPAHADYCLRYRFDPVSAHEATPTHPAPARRMRLQLKVLDRLAQRDVSGLLAGDAKRLRTTWSQMLAATEQSADVAPDGLLDPLETKLLKLLFGGSAKLSPIHYDCHALAIALSESGLEQPQPDLSVAHVLNAAWSARRRIECDEPDAAPKRVAQLATKARALAWEVLKVG
jgi:hypothetical protein